MRYTLILLFLFSLASCGGSTVTAAQQLASPVHLVSQGEAALSLDVNAQGLGVCSVGDVVFAIEWEGKAGRSRVGEIRHDGQLGAAAYEVGKGPRGWFVERLASDEGARRYPQPFARCAPADAFRAPSKAETLWSE